MGIIAHGEEFSWRGFVLELMLVVGILGFLLLFFPGILKDTFADDLTKMTVGGWFYRNHVLVGIPGMLAGGYALYRLSRRNKPVLKKD